MGKVTKSMKQLFLFHFVKSWVGIIIISLIVYLKTKGLIFFEIPNNNLTVYTLVLVVIWKASSFPFFHQKNTQLKFITSILIIIFYFVCLFILLSIMWGIGKLPFTIFLAFFGIVDYASNLLFSKQRKVNLLWLGIFVVIGLAWLSIMLFNFRIVELFFLPDERLKYYHYTTFFLIQNIALNLCYYLQFKNEKCYRTNFDNIKHIV